MKFYYYPIQNRIISQETDKEVQLSDFSTEIRQMLIEIHQSQHINQVCVGNVEWENKTYSINAYYDLHNEGISLELVPYFSLKNKAAPQQFTQIELLSHILENTSLEIVIFSPKGEYLFVNAAAIKSPEIREWIIGKTTFDFCEYRNWDISIAIQRKKLLDQCLAGKKEISLDEKLVKEGKNIYLRRTLLPVQNQMGEIEYIIGYSYPITILKDTQLELHRSEEKYRRIFQENSLPMWIMDMNSLSFLEVNQAAIDKYGYDREDFLQMKLPEIRHDDGIVAKSFFQSMLKENKKTFQNTANHFTKSGKEIFVEYYGIIFQEGNNVYTVSTLNDITDKRQFLATLQAKEETQKLIMNSAFDAIICIDMKGLITVWTQRAERMFGWTESEALGKGLIDTIIPLNLAEAHKVGFAKHIETGEQKILNKIVKLTARHKNGQVFPIELTVVFVNEKSNVFFCAYIRDISEEEQTKEILEKNVQDLQKLNSELDRFVYSTSHDLRAPLLSVLGLIDLTENTIKLGESSDFYFSLMKKSIHQMDATIKNILDYSRNARLEIRPQHIEVEKMIRNYIDSIFYLEKAKAIEFLLDIKEDADFYSDSLRFSTLVSNLITNAVKYSREGVMSFVKVSFHANPNEAVLCVEDNGEGIPENKLDKIFDMFFRNSVKSSGSGLGLYICKEIVDKMGGELTVSSEHKKGSKFEIRLPNLRRE